jgi:Skp family chaperone for outer membrane proteins
MKKTVFALFILLTGSLSNKMYAQFKIGYFDEKPVLSLMPGIQKIDTLLEAFNRDSLQGEYDYDLSEFKRKDDLLKSDSAAANKMSAGEKEMITRDRNMLAYKLSNWEAYKQNRLGAKQQELLIPFMDKLRVAFQQVITEGKYTYVLRAENLLYAPPGDDLVPAVCKKLKIILPAEYFGQQSTENSNKSRN